MNWFRSSSVRALVMGLGVAALLAAGVGIFIYEKARNIDQAGDRIVRTYELIGHLDASLAALATAESGARGFVATGDTAFLATFDEDLAASLQELAAARALSRDPAAIAAFGDVKRALDLNIDHLREGVQIAETERTGPAQAFIAQGEGRRLMADLRDAVSGLRQRELSLLDEARAESNNAETNATLTMAGMVGAMLLLMAANVVFAQRALRDQLRRREADERFRRVVDATGEAIVGLSRDLAFNSWSKGAEDLFGYTAAEAIGKPVGLLAVHGVEEETRAILSRVQSGASVLDLETVRRGKDGSLIPVSLSVFPLPGDDGAGTAFGGVIRDRRNQVAAEEALRAYERDLKRHGDLLEAIIDNSSSSIAVKDSQGRYVMVNSQWERLTGVTRAQVVGHMDADVLPPHLVDRARERDVTVSLTQGPSESEERVRGADGEERVFAARYVPLMGADGQIEFTCGFLIDITARQRLQDATEAARQAAESANQAKTDFLSRMSHELRTPLNVILGFAQIMELEPRNPDDEEAIDHILNAGRHLLSLIDEVLDLARVESNRISLSIETIDAGEAVEEVVALVRPLAGGRRITLAIAASPGRFHILADRQRIKQVMLNLLSNAIKYNREGGRVTVSFSPTASGYLRIEVADTGMGIRQERMPDLFRPFERLGAEETGVEGTGLGLALSSWLMEAMGGAIGAQSELGVGSTFWIEIPESDVPAPVESSSDRTGTTPAPAAASAGMVLYIEDNLANLSLVERVLELRPGIRLIAAMQGRIGIDLAREHRPDLVVLDLHLPDMTGQAVLHELQSDPATRDIPVVVASADATVGTIERLRAAGVSGFLTKPIDVRLLLETIDHAIGHA